MAPTLFQSGVEAVSQPDENTERHQVAAERQPIKLEHIESQFFVKRTATQPSILFADVT